MRNFKWEFDQHRLAGFNSNVEISFTFFHKIFYQDNAKMSEEYTVYSTVLFEMRCLDGNENMGSSFMTRLLFRRCLKLGKAYPHTRT